MLEFGFFVYGEYYGRNSNEGHIEIAQRILNKHPSWLSHFETQSKWKDPVDFLVYFKGAVKIGNRWGKKVVSYSSYHMDKEMEGCLAEYKSARWQLDDMFLLN